MEKKRNWRIYGLWLLIVFSVLYCLPTLAGKGNLPSWYSNVFPKKLNFGLDLQGGLELRYTVDWKKAIQDNGVKLGDTIRSQMVDELAKQKNENAADLERAAWDAYASRVKVSAVDYQTIRLQFQDEESASIMEGDVVTNLDPRYELLGVDSTTFDLLLPDEQVATIREQIVSETRSTISRRAEAIGLVDPDVRVAGESDIVVQIPGVDKASMDVVRKHIGRTAQLTLRMVDRESTYFADLAPRVDAFKAERPDRATGLRLVTGAEIGAYLRSEKKSELIAFLATLDDVPADHVIGFEKIEEKDEFGNLRGQYFRTHLTFAKAEITGEQLARAQVSYDEQGPYVLLDLNSEGARLFADLTERNVGEYMAIMLDDDVNSAPVIQEKIGGGRARITMGQGRSPQQVLADAKGLVTVLNNGAYRAPVYKVQDNEVGPSLGADSVAAGELAMSLGMLLVIIFMLLYYNKSGIVAVTVLVLNVLFILTLLVSFNSALTLPGMAGIILTIGMAVDANIIIYERIREEILAGRSPRAAVDAGYEKAWSTILDANVTTALAGVILLNYTSGPIRGFAVTLLMGIVSSVFTAVWVSRQLFNWWLTRSRPDTLSI